MYNVKSLEESGNKADLLLTYTPCLFYIPLQQCPRRSKFVAAAPAVCSFPSNETSEMQQIFQLWPLLPCNFSHYGSMGQSMDTIIL